MNFKKILFFPIAWLLGQSFLIGQVQYELTYDNLTETYTVSITSGTPYSGGFARMSSSSQITVVAPHITGGFQITNLTDLQPGGTPLDWTFSRLDAPIENPADDYIFFAPNNAFSYTPFDIPANTKIDLFSFESGTGCEGSLNIYDEATDPLGGNPNYNPDNNMVILGGGNTNLYTGNISGNVLCPLDTEIIYCLEYNPVTEVYIVSMESNQTFLGGFARISASNQATIVAPHVPGGFQIVDLTNLQAGTPELNWDFTRLDAPTENTDADYIFFATTNSNSYEPFDIIANTRIDLFSFKGTGCFGEVDLYESATDPLESNPSYNPDHSISILGAGIGNKFARTCTDPVTPCNNPPLALNDTLSVAKDTSGVNILVQINDSDPDGDTIATRIINAPTSGSMATVLNSDSIFYTPLLGFVGLDTIVYEICDNGALPLCDTAIVYITIEQANCAPFSLANIITTTTNYTTASATVSAAAAGSGFTGTWTLENGGNGTETISDINVEILTFSGMRPGVLYTLRWTVVCDADSSILSFDEIQIISCQQITVPKIFRKTSQ